MIQDIRFTRYNLMGIKGTLEKTIKQLDEIEETARRIRIVEYVATAYFESCERYCWVIDIFVRLTLDDDMHKYIRVYSEHHTKNNTPAYIFERMCELRKTYQFHDYDFDPMLWKWKEDNHLSRWIKRC